MRQNDRRTSDSGSFLCTDILSRAPVLAEACVMVGAEGVDLHDKVRFKIQSMDPTPAFPLPRCRF